MKILDRGASFARRLSVFYLFTIVLVMFFGFFYYKYIPGNQSELDSRGFRILNQVSANIVAKDVGIAAIVKNLDFFRTNDSIDADLKDQLLKNADCQIFYDTSSSHRGDDHIRVFGDQGQSVIYEMKKYQAVIPVKDFMAPIFESRDDLFETYVLLKKEKNSDRNRRFPEMSILYNQKNLSSSSIVNMDSSLSLEKNTDLASITDIQISGTSYKFFSRPFVLYKDQLILAGVINKKDYDKKVKALPVQFVSFIVIFILLGIILLPYLKVFLLSPKENMERSDVIGTTLSIYTGTSVLVLIAFYLVIYYVTVSTFSSRLKDVANKITDDTEQELDAAGDQLNRYATIYQSLTTEEKKVLYYVKTDSNTFAKVDSLFTPDVFKNIYRLFWIDPKGNTLAKWNPYDFNAPLTNTRSYTYYDLLKDKTEDDTSLVVYPGKSNITNEFQVFFMKRSSVPIDTIAGCTSNSMAIGLAGFLNSCVRPVLPDGFGFCLVSNQTGDVLIHSDNRRNLSENILTETEQNEQLRNCLNNRTAAELDNVNIYGAPNIMYVKPVKGQQLSLVAFYNTDLFLVNIFRMVHFAAETILYVFLVLSICLFFSTRYITQPSKLEFKLNPVEWLRPSWKNVISYSFTARYFISLICFSLTIFGIIFVFHGDIRSVYYISLLIPFYSVWGFLASRMKENSMVSTMLKNKTKKEVAETINASEKSGTKNNWIENINERYTLMKGKYSFLELISMSKAIAFVIFFMNWIFVLFLLNNDFGHGISAPVFVFLFQFGAIRILIFCYNLSFKSSRKLMSIQFDKDSFSEDEAKENFSALYVRSLFYSVLLTVIIPVSGIILYALRAEKIQYAKTNAFSIAQSDLARQQFIISSILPGYKEAVFERLISSGYFEKLRDSTSYYLTGEEVSHEILDTSTNPLDDEPYITLLDDLFLITSGEYNSYSLHEKANDSSWTFGNKGASKIKMNRLLKKDGYQATTPPGTLVNISVDSGFKQLLYSFSNVNWMFSVIIGILISLFLWFGRRFFTMLVNRIFLLNFVDKDFKPKKDQSWLRTFHPDPGSADNEEMQILERCIANTEDYQKIWTNLDPAEQYLLYDFSLDGYTNYKDAGTIIRLMEKTVLLYENNELKFFDLAFRNFILTKKGTPEVEKLKQTYSVPGIWQTIRIPALVLIAVTAIFLLLTQENVSHKLAGLITSVGALIPLALEITKRAAGKSS